MAEEGTFVQRGEGPDEATAEVEPPFFPEDESRMALTAEERQWALAIKAAVQADPEVEEEPDFWYVQLALMEQDNVEGAVVRAKKVQNFRQEYEAEDNYEFAVRVLRDFQQLLPEFWMAFSYQEREQGFVFMADISKFYIRVLEASDTNTKIWISMLYFISHTCNPDFHAMRVGSITLAENTGFDWKTNFGVRAFQKMCTDITNFYPTRYRKLKNFHSGVFMNLILSISKPLLPKEIHSVFEMGCSSGFGPLDKIYMQPSVEAANKKFLKNTSYALRRRYDNQASFTL